MASAGESSQVMNTLIPDAAMFSKTSGLVCSFGNFAQPMMG
jgi:hypothetical protein